MTKEEIRLECYHLAAIQAEKPGAKTPAAEIAVQLAEFCGEDALKLQALKWVIGTQARQLLESTFAAAMEYVNFAVPPAPVRLKKKTGRSRYPK